MYIEPTPAHHTQHLYIVSLNLTKSRNREIGCQNCRITRSTAIGMSSRFQSRQTYFNPDLASLSFAILGGKMSCRLVNTSIAYEVILITNDPCIEHDDIDFAIYKIAVHQILTTKEMKWPQNNHRRTLLPVDIIILTFLLQCQFSYSSMTKCDTHYLSFIPHSQRMYGIVSW